MLRPQNGNAVRRILIAAIFAGDAIITIACGKDRPASATAPTPTTTVTAVVVAGASTSGASFQLTATARMSDGTSRDVTSSATWESSNPTLAIVSPTGLVTVLGAGELDVRATYQGVTGTMHLLVARLPVVAITLSGGPSPSSANFQMTATARLADRSTQDVSRSATWETSNSQLATISPTGSVTILADGEVDIRATYQGVSGSMHLSVALPRRFTVSGLVLEAAPNTQRIAGARVQIVGGDHVFSDAQASFSLPGVTFGRIILEVSKQGYQTFSNEFMVDRDLQLGITLYPTPPTNSSGATATARCNDGSWSWAQARSEACTANGGIAYPVCPGPLCGS